MSRRVKVIHVVEDLKVGGQEKVIATIATSLNSEKYDVEIWCLARSGDVAEWLRHSGVIVKTLNLSSYHHPLNVARLAWRLRRSCADLLHTHGSFAGTFGRLAAILVGMRGVVAHVHTTDFGLRKRHVLIQRMLAPFTRRIICISEAVRHFVESVEHIPTTKTCLIYNGVHGFREVPREKAFSRLTWGFRDRGLCSILGRRIGGEQGAPGSDRCHAHAGLRISCPEAADRWRRPAAFRAGGEGPSIQLVGER